MKAAYIEQPGAPEKIIFGDLPKPKVSGSQVLVKVAAVAVNPIDTYIRGGMFPMELPKPYVLGCDLAGVVEAVGPQVQRLKPGDRVWGSNQGLLGRQGVFSEYAAVEECWLYIAPEEVSFEEAAAIALVGITAHLGLFRVAKLKMGESILVNGGSGGVGACVIQMARAAGARVVALAGTPEKVQLCKQLGANVALNYRGEDLEAAIRKFGAVDVWWETSRTPDLDRAVEHMALRGRLIVMAGRDAKPTMPLGRFYTKDCSMHGFAMFNAPAEEQRKCAAEMNRWMAKGRLRARIDRVMRLKDTAAAHRLQEESTVGGSGALSGKIVLIP